MYKVLIADDEHKICLLIDKLIDWQGIGLDCAGIVHDGEAAYKIIQETKPDIVITDIQMPRLNGIELIKRVRSDGSHCKFIVFSGHKQFDYARDAFKYDAVDYLLKPVNQEELNSALRKICGILSSEQDNVRYVTSLETRLKGNRRKLREIFIENCINGTITENLDECNSEYGLKLGKGFYVAVYIAIDDHALNAGQNKQSVISSRVTEIFEESLSGYSTELMTSPMDGGVLAILFSIPEQKQELNKRIQFAFNSICQYASSFSSVSATIGVGATQDDHQALPKAIHTALRAAQCRILLGRNRCIYYSELKYRYMNAEKLMHKAIKLKLSRCFEILDGNGYVQWLDFILSSLDSNYLPAVIHDICEDICGVFDEMKNKILPGFEFPNGSLKTEMISGIHLASGLHEARNIMCHSVLSRMDIVMEQKSSLEQAPIRDAKNYIAEHYMEQVTLDDIARKVYMHPAYLSTIFKKNTGMNFSDYLTEYRIEKAKELLTTTNDRVIDIARSVGYIEPHSFSKRFTSSVGIKPTDYRKLHS